ncbi:MAG: DMT family transporter, partial [Desulfobacterales bacterium]|nr:DMT family transporter [Desulfobacterales bacterium]
MPHLLITAYSIFIGTAFLLPFSLYEYISYGIDHISLESWVAIIFLGVIASCVAFLLYNYSLTHIEAGAAAIYVNLSPFVTIIAAAYYLGER